MKIMLTLSIVLYMVKVMRIINLPRYKTMRYYKTEFDEFISKQREDKLKELGIENT